ncbi:MAG TPA: hypothetical protein VGL05_19490 [Kribbella sp.]
MPFPEETEFHLPDGITLNGGLDSDGVLVTCEKASGWGSPGSKSQGQSREGEHGSSPAPNPKMQPRVMQISGRITAPTRLLRQQTEHRLEAALGLDLFELTVVDGIELTVQTQRSGDVTIDDDTDTTSNWLAELTCPDPRRYGAAKTLTMNLPSTSGGVRFPVRFPLRFTGTMTSGDASATNDGNETAPVKVTFTGPLTTPRLTNQTTGQWVQYNDTLATADDFVVLYLRTPLVALLQDTALRTGKVSTGGGGTWGVKPGANQLGFRAGGGSGTALIEFSDTYQ